MESWITIKPLYKLDSVVIKSISIAMISGVVFLIITCMMCLLHFMSSEEGGNGKAGTV